MNLKQLKSRKIKDGADIDVATLGEQIRDVATYFDDVLFNVSQELSDSDRFQKAVKEYLLEAKKNLAIALQSCVKMKKNGFWN